MSQCERRQGVCLLVLLVRKAQLRSSLASIKLS